MKKIINLASTFLLASLAIDMPAAAETNQSNTLGRVQIHFARNQEYRNNLVEAPNTLDPTLAAYDSSFQVIRSLFDTLVRLDPQGQFVPLAAASWDISEDRKVYTFHLRPYATWTDGKAVTAQDFVYSWQRLVNPQTDAEYSSYLAEAGVVNAQAILEGKLSYKDLGVRAIDDFTFEVRLEKATPWFIDMLALSVLSPLRQDIIAKFGADWTLPQNIVSNGPFKLTTVNDEKIQLKKWSKYWDAQNTVIRTVTYDFEESAIVNYYNYLGGIYPTTEIPPAFYTRVKEERPEEIRMLYPAATQFYKINNEQITNNNVRKALSLLLDRKFMINRVLGYGQASTVLAPAQVEGAQLLTPTSWSQESYARNIYQAQDLLKKEGYSYEHPLEIELLAGTSSKSQKVTMAFQQMLEKNSGEIIKVNVVNLEQKDIANRVHHRNYQLVIGGWEADYNQAHSFFELFLCNSGHNNIGYCNPKYDYLVLEALKTTSPEKRAQLYAQANNILIEKDNAIIPFLTPQKEILVSPGLGGLNTNNSVTYVRDLYFIKDVFPKAYK